MGGKFEVLAGRHW